MYICQLTKQEQIRIKRKVRNKLRKEGYTGKELEYYIQLVMDSKVSDIN